MDQLIAPRPLPGVIRLLRVFSNGRFSLTSDLRQVIRDPISTAMTYSHTSLKIEFSSVENIFSSVGLRALILHEWRH